MLKKSKRLPTKPEKAISVKSVQDEKKIIRELKCEHCSRIGVLFTKGQALTFYKGTPLDEIHLECVKCGKEYDVYFDISSIETPYGKMGECLRFDPNSEFAEEFDLYYRKSK